jgi:hypothetical protein
MDRPGCGRDGYFRNDVPLAYKPFELTPAEQAAVGRYLTCGGFLFCDECVRTASSTYITVPRAFLRMVGLGFETQGLVEGRGWHAGRVPEDHPLLHCYFDFDAPPVGYAFNMSAHPLYVDEPMIGVFCRDSLVGIITRRSYHEPWGGRQGQLASRRRALEFGINTIVYALTREGSITRRLMDTVQ